MNWLCRYFGHQRWKMHGRTIIQDFSRVRPLSYRCWRCHETVPVNPE